MTDWYFYALFFILVLYPLGYAIIDGLKYLSKKGRR